MKLAEKIRDSLLFFFSDEGKNLREFTEQYVVDGIDSLNKTAFFLLLERIGQERLLDGIPKDTDVFVSVEEKELVDLIVRLYDMFGLPDIQDYINPQHFRKNTERLFNISLEVGPYLPAV